MSEARELLKRAASVLHDKFDGVKYMEPLIEEIDAYLAKPEPEPDYWHVVDKEGNSIYSASFKQACIDHINEAMLADSWDSDVGLWVVRPLYTELPVRKPLTDDEIDSLPFVATPSSLTKGLRRFARAVEGAHGIE